MKILMTNHALDSRGGSESYLETVAWELRRLGHGVVFYSARCGSLAERLRHQGFEVHQDAAHLPRDLDVIHGQHANAVAQVRERFSTLPLVFATHSWLISIEDPIAELGAGAYVAFNELTRSRLGAHAATRGKEIIRLTQPVQVSFADGVRVPAAEEPRRAVAVSRRMTTLTARLARACARLDIEFERIGGDESELPDPRRAMLGADIVFAMGRTALEAMAAARAVVVIDEVSFGGWVSDASYADLEADGFTGLGPGGVDRGVHSQDDALVELLSAYGPQLGIQARRLVARHHVAQHHAAALMEVYTSVADAPASPVAPASITRLAEDRYALEHRAVAAEWDVARLQGAVRDLQAELEGVQTELSELQTELDARLREREHLLARIDGLGDRLRRARARARLFRRQRDKARLP